MNGKLFGLGVGPGDPELLTIKALRIIQESDVIAVPGNQVEDSVAYQIVKGVYKELDSKVLLPVAMPMTKDKAVLEANHEKAADDVEVCLKEGKQVADTIEHFILQPQSEIFKVRQFLAEHHFRIEAEDMTEEDGKFYPVMRVVHGESESYSACEYQYGKCLLNDRHPVLYRYLKREMAIKESVFRQLFGHRDSESAKVRMEEVRREILLVQEALTYFEEDVYGTETDR